MANRNLTEQLMLRWCQGRMRLAWRGEYFHELLFRVLEQGKSKITDFSDFTILNETTKCNSIKHRLTKKSNDHFPDRDFKPSN